MGLSVKNAHCTLPVIRSRAYTLLSAELPKKTRPLAMIA
jgi:hypothetical protein